MTVKTFNLPDLGEGLTEADLARWLVSEGEHIEVDQPIAEVETAKALVEVPSPFAGTVATLHGAAGQTLVVHAPLISVQVDGEPDGARPGEPDGARPGEPDGGRPGALDYREEERAGTRVPEPNLTPDLDRVRGGDGAVDHAEAEYAVQQTVREGHRVTDRPDTGGAGVVGGAAGTDAAGSARSGDSGEAADEGSGSVLIGYGTSGAQTTRRTRPSKRARTTASDAGEASGAGGTVSTRGAPVPAPRVASPIVRKLARELSVDVATVNGSGPHGLILRTDIVAAADHKPSAGPAPAATTATGEATHGGRAPSSKTVAETDLSEITDLSETPAGLGDVDPRSGLAVRERVPMTGVRRMIAEQMTRSRATIPEATAWLDVDATALVELRAGLKADEPQSAPSLLALIARFTVAALQRYPVMCSRVETGPDGEQIVYFDGVNLGLAAQTDRGLVVPAIEHAERYSARGLHTEIADLVARARKGKCTPAELTRGTFTLNNYGVFGTDGAAAIINAPEVAILGVGRILDRPWVVDGQIVVRQVTELTLSFDHRVTDGGTASAFLTSVARAIENPASALADL